MAELSGLYVNSYVSAALADSVDHLRGEGQRFGGMDRTNSIFNISCAFRQYFLYFVLFYVHLGQHIPLYAHVMEININLQSHEVVGINAAAP